MDLSKLREQLENVDSLKNFLDDNQGEISIGSYLSVLDHVNHVKAFLEKRLKTKESLLLTEKRA